MKILVSHYNDVYKKTGKWDKDKLGHLIKITGYDKRQLNKWMWDRLHKEKESLKAKQKAYPGIIFTIKNMKNGKDLTPDFSKVCIKPLFRVEKVDRKGCKLTSNVTLF